MIEPSPADQPFVSYAQNREDVVLWRALRDVANGRYVDVGAADPVIDSVTAALYERGWRGINIEPVPRYAAALMRARPGDVVVACGIGAVAQTRRLSVVDGTGLSTFDPGAVALASERGWEIAELSVAIRTLDDVVSDHLTADDDVIHLLKIDVEGLEAEVLAGADLARWRPWVLVIEATRPGTTTPSHEEWEHMVVEAGYRFCLFDGLNRFYVHRDHEELAAPLSYPACALDGAIEDRQHVELRRQLDESRTEVERREQRVAAVEAEHQLLLSAHDSLATAHRSLVHTSSRAASEHQSLQVAHRSLADDHRRLVADRDALSRAHASELDRAAGLQAAYEQALSSASWRLTRPLRTVRARFHRSDTTPHNRVEPDAPSSVGTSTVVDAGGSETPDRAPFQRRLRQASQLLVSGDASHSVARHSANPETTFAVALASSSVEPIAAAWLSYVVATGTYPDEPMLRAEARLLRRLGPHAYTEHLADLAAESSPSDGAASADLDPIIEGVVIDITHTVQHDLQTGIQRVVRETCSRWLARDRVVPVWWDYGSNVLRRLPPGDVERFKDWRERLASAVPGSEPRMYSLDARSSGIAIPWGTRLVLPELAAEPERTEGYRALACSGVIDALAVIGYDIIPVTAAETVTEAMSHRFSLYLSMLKRSHRLAAISEAAANDFRGYNAALGSQGLVGPIVEAHPLPPSPTQVDDVALASFRAKLGVGLLPLVLVVGSHEPRKNHITVLDAAERLWSEGVTFMLLFIGGSGWRSDAFDSEVERLQALGRPVQVSRRASEEELWAAYRVARFSVFPSLVEGYGLPIVESIASGTPVITTNYGSMAEVAQGGGAVLIDPYDSDMLADRMRRLLLDDAELERLQAEAAARRFPTWDEYADDVWRFFVEDDIAE